MTQTNLEKGDEVYVKKMRKTALKAPTAGPFVFMKYSDSRKVACLVKNPIINKVTTVSTSNVILSKLNFPESEHFLSI